MATITIKKVPEPLYEELRRSAKRNRRSINQEAIACFERVLRPRRVDAEAFLADLRRLHERLPRIDLPLEDVEAGINEGRP
ncbi:MAG: hypothetical protein HY703_08655 [Gemmatimonadetes bacterium]|nr:hypothetical protein [Gemmatimonadota bacterium]